MNTGAQSVNMPPQSSNMNVSANNVSMPMQCNPMSQKANMGQTKNTGQFYPNQGTMAHSQSQQSMNMQRNNQQMIPIQQQQIIPIQHQQQMMQIQTSTPIMTQTTRTGQAMHSQQMMPLQQQMVPLQQQQLNAPQMNQYMPVQSYIRAPNQPQLYTVNGVQMNQQQIVSQPNVFTGNYMLR